MSLVGLGLLLAWSTNLRAGPWDLSVARAADIPPDLVIVMDRSDCFTWCPDYSLMISGSGRVVYLGRDNVKVVGQATGSIDPAALARLIDRFEALNFYSLRDRYTREDCWRGRTDMPTVMISLYMHGRPKRVEWDATCPVPQLEELMRTIDRETDSHQWVK